jgi:uncharacterized protein YbbC (DUF1343 family)
MLQGLDALVYDVQDTGCRSYTYIATMGLAMEACAIAGVEFVVLDRPNPLGGLRIEGPRLSAQFIQIKSLVSRWDVPYVYGMTCGELARMINGERWIARPCRLTVIPMQGWDRHMVWRNTGLPWVPTSPRIARPESPMYYVATGVLGEIGGVNIGTTLNMAFECITAPWLDGVKLSRQLAAYQLPGVNFVPLKVSSAQGPLSGVRIVFSDPNRTPLLPINLYALEAIKRVSGRDLFAEAQRAGKVFSMFDRVNGTEATRLALQARRPVTEIVQSWQIAEQLFRQQRQKYLLY